MSDAASARKSPKKKGEAVGVHPRRGAVSVGRRRDDIAASAQRVQPATDELNGRQVCQQQVLAQDDYIAAPERCVQPAVDDIATSPAHNEPAPDVGFTAQQYHEQPLRIDQQDHDPSPRFDHEMALKFYNAVRPDGIVLGYTEGRPVRDANQFEQIANEADSRREHLFFAVATLKPEWSDPNTHKKGKVTTPSKDKAVNMPDGSKSHIHEHPYWGFDCDAEKYSGNDPAEAAQHYEREGQRIKASLDKAFARLGIRPFAVWRSGAGWQGLIKLGQPITSEEYEGLDGKLHIALGFDPVVRNCNRILRVPGSVNWKNGKDGRVPSSCDPLTISRAISKLEDVRKALANIVEPAETPKVNDKAEIQIDWAKVKSPGWLKSAADLPPDAPPKLKLILGHTGILAELTKDLMAAELLNKPYRSWSEVTFALAAVFKQWGKYGVEEIAEALMADLPCNRHITDNPDPHRGVERAINRSHDRILGLPGYPAINLRDFTEKGKARASLANAVIAIKALGIVIRLDLFHHRIIVEHNGTISTVQEGILTDDTIDAIRSLINNTYRLDCKEYVLQRLRKLHASMHSIQCSIIWPNVRVNGTAKSGSTHGWSTTWAAKTRRSIAQSGA
jgi:hypothetical protein